MARAEPIVSPDGDHWTVSRQWVKGPKVRWGLRRKPRAEDLDWIEPSPFDFIDSPAAILAAIAFFLGLLILAALTAFVILPLLGIAVEAAIALALLLYGLIARVLFRRPWVIEVRNHDRPERSWEFKAVGWQRSRELIADAKQLLATGGDLDRHLTA